MALEVVLRVEKLARVYPTGAGVREVSFTLGKGEIGALVGPNGSGKTTLLDALAGQSPHSGEVWILGKNPRTPPPDGITSPTSPRSGTCHPF